LCYYKAKQNVNINHDKGARVPWSY